MKNPDLKNIRKTLYKEILEHVPIACVDIAIVVGGSVLMVKRDDPPAKGEWWLPGGRVLKGEMMQGTALRKAKEEVGIECHVGPLIHTAEIIFPDGPFGISVHSINSCFFLYPVETDFKIKLDAHQTDFKWVKSIPNNIHEYVERCLMGAGLKKESIHQKRSIIKS